MAGRWAFPGPLVPPAIGRLTVLDAADVESVARQVDFVFCAVDMKKEEIRALEERYAKAEVPVISNNSANRHTPDVPMLIPEINGAHAAVIEAQRRRLAEKAPWHQARLYRRQVQLLHPELCARAVAASGL